MSIFQVGDFTLHSGQQSGWKIDCDGLTKQDWTALALMLSEKLPPFGHVFGVPTGGLRLAMALRDYRDTSTEAALIVDDVLTTGKSLEEFKVKAIEFTGFVGPWHGAVVFARGQCPDWVSYLFRM